MTRHTSLPGAAFPVFGQLLLARRHRPRPRRALPSPRSPLSSCLLTTSILVTSGRFALAAHELLRRPKSSSELLFAVM